ncbi:hypothetical protein COCCU_03730 [Corynebacterium occultum]|uniref:Uncharacterized protein n=1 Tax=Corynebacterium occultum TaxID=2675219 RepID=A0A6B8W5V6_9CORY|nr:hypothetical protein [Corynebacterium occultum]QGU06695.1 hypothetical protein COCCU_03730 [Corynebacterium occultum]
MMDSWDRAENPRGTVVTLWFVTASSPAEVIAAEPRADRGYGRKLLAQMNPAWPISPIGQFPLNRSTPAAEGEFYIAGFPGVTVIQTVVPDLELLSELSPRLRNAVKAPDVYAFALNEAADFGGLAHWHRGELKRSLCARPMELREDLGLPEPFESPFWAGERGTPRGGIYLPFDPPDLVVEAQRSWLGFEVSPAGPDINVVAYAVDGRPEPKVQPHPTQLRRSVGEIASAATARLGIGASRGDYDDYEEHEESSSTSEELARLAGAAAGAAKRAGRGLRSRARSLRETVVDKLRHTDRP